MFIGLMSGSMGAAMRSPRQCCPSAFPCCTSNREHKCVAIHLVCSLHVSLGVPYGLGLGGCGVAHVKKKGNAEVDKHVRGT